MTTHSEEEDRSIGRPTQALRGAFSVPAVHDPFSGVMDGNGANVETVPRVDEGLGRPPQAPKESRPVTEADLDDLRRLQALVEEAERRRLDELLATEATILRLPAYLGHPLIIAFSLGMAALLGLFVISHITSTLAAMETFAPGFRYAGYAALLLLTACILYATARVTWMYIRFRTNRPIAYRGLSELARRTKMHWLVHKKKQEARDQLLEFLRLYPLETDKPALISLGLTEERLNALVNVRGMLLDQSRFGDHAIWFEQYRSRFQSVLDEAAESRITYFSRRVALMTAISPNTLVDVLLTFYCSFTMIGDLCRIYQLRLGTLSTLALLAHIFFNAYVAGQLNEFEETAEVGIESLWQELAAQVGTNAALNAFGKLGAKAGARSGSAVLNYFLLRRLGKSAARSLQPMPPP